MFSQVEREKALLEVYCAVMDGASGEKATMRSLLDDKRDVALRAVDVMGEAMMRAQTARESTDAERWYEQAIMPVVALLVTQPEVRPVFRAMLQVAEANEAHCAGLAAFNDASLVKRRMERLKCLI